MNRRGFIAKGLMVFAGAGLAACQLQRREEPVGRAVYRYNRPPDTPAHGYRHLYGTGVILVYDSKINAYRVERRNSYYYRGRFYRVHEGHWETSPDIDRPWHATSGRELPTSLRRSAIEKDKARGRRKKAN